MKISYTRNGVLRRLPGEKLSADKFFSKKYRIPLPLFFSGLPSLTLKSHGLMKTHIFQLSFLVLFYVICAALFISCNVLNSQTDARLSPVSYRLDANEKARVSYEAETVTVTRYDGDIPEPLREQYALRLIPAISRSRVEVSIDKAGQTRWVIEDVEPGRKIPDGRHNVPPDLSPKVKKTVIHDQRADFYDAAGKLIRTGRMDMPDMTEINGFLKYAGSGEEDMAERIARARKNGSHIREHSNGNLTIRTWKTLTDFYRRDGSGPAAEVPPEKVEIRELVDTKNNLIVATALYNQSGEPLEETRLKYRDGTRELQHIHSVSTVTDRNRVKVKNITDTYFDYLHVMISDN